MKPSRRKFFRTLGTGAAGMTIGHTVSRAATEKRGRGRAAKTDADAPTLLVGDNIAVTSTTSGPVRGYVLRGIHYFLGLPYGADTSGANRFMPPQKPKPWTDVYQALWWGNSAPQNTCIAPADSTKPCATWRLKPESNGAAALFRFTLTTGKRGAVIEGPVELNGTYVMPFVQTLTVKN